MGGPWGGGPLPHVHSREEECSYVLEGEVILWIGDTRTVARAGAFVGLPVGVPHAFKNEAEQPARLLFTVVPAGLEGFFFEAGIEVVSDDDNATLHIADDLDRTRPSSTASGSCRHTRMRRANDLKRQPMWADSFSIPE